jgi:hypothetical protein
MLRQALAETSQDAGVVAAGIMQPGETDREPRMLGPPPFGIDQPPLGGGVVVQEVQRHADVEDDPRLARPETSGTARPVERLVEPAERGVRIREIRHRSELVRVQLEGLQVGQTGGRRLVAERLEVAPGRVGQRQIRLDGQGPPDGGGRGHTRLRRP